jgi:hypothetical protein
MSDYLELPLYCEEDDERTLYVHLKDKSVLAFFHVKHDPIRYEGWWTIPHMFHGRRASSSIPADDVRYFTTVDVDKVTENVTLEDSNVIL